MKVLELLRVALIHRRALGLAILVSCFFASDALANMGRISDGGSAHLLGENSAVTMESEVINITVGKDLLRADCQFMFVNHGPKCTVRMGFPDQVLKWSDKTQGGPVGGFLSYKTYVDGVETKTEYVRAEQQDKHGEYNSWHANEVSFEENGTHKIRNVYTTRPSVRPVTDKLGAKLVNYTLHTGSSWNGPIVSSVVNFTFDKAAAPEPLNPVDMRSLDEDENGMLDWQHASPGTVLYAASKSPIVSGATIRFEFSNLKPSVKDDIEILYGRLTEREADKFDNMVQKETSLQYTK